MRSTIASITEAMSDAPAFRDLVTVYADGNLQAFENGLMRAYLESAVAGCREPVMRSFFVLFIDLRNLMLVYKRLRWNVGDGGAFTAGGNFSPSDLESLVARRDSAALDDLIRDATNLRVRSVAESEGALETVLLGSMTRQLLRGSHTGDGIGLIVIYMWRLYVQARNLAVLHHAASLDARTLERELVLL
jgi:vacuolar-type H+-ATPase subunit C/Vma6